MVANHYRALQNFPANDANKRESRTFFYSRLFASFAGRFAEAASG